jgi:hypothetical protein
LASRRRKKFFGELLFRNGKEARGEKFYDKYESEEKFPLAFIMLIAANCLLT